MSRSGVVPPPPFFPPDVQPPQGEDEDWPRYAFIRFPREIMKGRPNDLVVKLKNHPDALLVIEGQNFEVFVLFRDRDGQDPLSNLGEWIDSLGEPRLFDRVRLGWVRNQGEMVRFAK